MLPPPTLSFTIPSLHDSTPLNCRVYHPQSLSPNPTQRQQWTKHTAVVAHPYAPLGGCYDDPIVDIVAGTLLRLGFLIGTFNFRGASGSPGRTSWTSKPERADYASVVGFLAYYAHYLDPFPEPSPTANPESNSNAQPILLLAGYSYGAIITTHLPPLPTILSQFSTAPHGAPAAEIRLRAEHLAETQNTVLRSVRQPGPASPRKSIGLIRVGGDEEVRKSHELRGSYDVRRSFGMDAEERTRKGVGELRSGWRRKRERSMARVGQSQGDGACVSDVAADGENLRGDSENLPPVDRLTRFRVAYLLVSPLPGLVTHLATMSFSRAFSAGHASTAHDTEAEAEDKLVQNPTFAVYGDRDVFVGVKKVRDWAARLEAVPDSRFRAHEVRTAGHFWVEERVAYVMRDAVRIWAEGLLQDGERGQAEAE